jgi:segregation and condensation protein B
MSEMEQPTQPDGGIPAGPDGAAPKPEAESPAPAADATPKPEAETAPATPETKAEPADAPAEEAPSQPASEPPATGAAAAPAAAEGAPPADAQPGKKAKRARTPKAEKGPAPKVPADIKRVLEALLFASDAPLTPAKLRDVLPRVSAQAVKEAAAQLKEEYAQGGHAFELVEIAEGYQLLTKPEHDEWIARLRKAKGPTKLSGAALETLAIVAYKQPIRRVDIEAIRGVQSGELVRALMERGLVRIAGRADQPGSPLLYGTTKEFLDVVGLKSLDELPKPEEVK